MNNRQLTLGSLFDGSGGFPLAGILAGIKPIWASEIEPFPIRVTTKRLPEMKHYRDSRIGGVLVLRNQSQPMRNYHSGWTFGKHGVKHLIHQENKKQKNKSENGWQIRTQMLQNISFGVMGLLCRVLFFVLAGIVWADKELVNE